MRYRTTPVKQMSNVYAPKNDQFPRKINAGNRVDVTNNTAATCSYQLVMIESIEQVIKHRREEDYGFVNTSETNMWVE
jgi:hypothetical protein